MKIIFKTALKEDQLMSRNQKDIDGVEIQMLDFSDDFSLMKKLTINFRLEQILCKKSSTSKRR